MVIGKTLLAGILSLLLASPAFAGTIAGTVHVAGTIAPPPPLTVTLDKDTCGPGPTPDPSILVAADGSVANAVVMLVGPVPGDWTATEWKLDQKKCVFVPHVVVLPVGKKLQVENTDGILHNFHTFCRTNAASNVAQPPSVRVLERTWDNPEAFRVECDVHSWMSAFIVVAENPYYFVTGSDGGFRLDNVPDGKYTLAFVHEKLGRLEKPVEVKGTKPVMVDFVLPTPTP